MKIIVFGATGKTGRQVVQRALDAGHEVTAFVRDPARLDVHHPQLHVSVGQVTTDQAAVTAAVEGHDAVISALGTARTLHGMRSPTIMSQAMPVIIQAMTDGGVDRLVFLSSFGVGDSYAAAPPLLKVMFRYFLGPVYADKAAAEKLLRDSTLNWTLVYPVLLTNGPHTGAYRSDVSVKLTGMPRISRADVADFMLNQIDSSAFSRSVAVLTPGK
ncbi:putative NADH-flavin reductase [Streptacidiphilus sp. MAP12-16]|uniref:NAD(P)-dependent oxidoreductase n=1 Tax=Streptacidiphilus sp. MAP12-16 TaxID=3156300 RepID=UPI003517572C